jgi:hypothetical protein
MELEVLETWHLMLYRCIQHAIVMGLEGSLNQYLFCFCDIQMALRLLLQRVLPGIKAGVAFVSNYFL